MAVIVEILILGAICGQSALYLKTSEPDFLGKAKGDTIAVISQKKENVSDFSHFIYFFYRIFHIVRNDEQQDTSSVKGNITHSDTLSQKNRTSEPKPLSIDDIYNEMLTDTMPSPFTLDTNFMNDNNSGIFLPLSIDDIDTTYPLIGIADENDRNSERSGVYFINTLQNEGNVAVRYLVNNPENRGVGRGSVNSSSTPTADNRESGKTRSSTGGIKQKEMKGNFIVNFITNFLEALNEFRSKVRKTLGFDDE